mmetsp:Transcript_18347/g.27866  ORF Transcript_18347/g.27866 Transcript_18347/m.27866 type:complete len:88 (-) Transcript_18347:118-381(-)
MTFTYDCLSTIRMNRAANVYSLPLASTYRYELVVFGTELLHHTCDIGRDESRRVYANADKNRAVNLEMQSKKWSRYPGRLFAIKHFH